MAFISVSDAYYGLAEGAFDSDFKGVIAEWRDHSRDTHNTINLFGNGELIVYGKVISNDIQSMMNFFDDESSREDDFELIYLHPYFK